jgi:hypothetical protein
MSLSDDIDLEEFITMKNDLSGADIKVVSTEAGLLVLREHRWDCICRFFFLVSSFYLYYSPFMFLLNKPSMSCLATIKLK